MAVAGRIQTRNYEAADGQRRYITEVVAEEVHFLDSRNKSDNREYGQNFPPEDSDVSLEDNDLFPIDDESELPF